MTVCNTLARQCQEWDVPGIIYTKDTSVILTTVEAVYSAFLFVIAMNQGSDVQQWNLDDPHVRNIVYLAASEIVLSTLIRLPYTDVRNTALKIVLLVFVLFPLPFISVLCAWGGNNQDLSKQALAYTTAGFAFMGRVAITYSMSQSSVDRHRPENRPLNA